MTSESVKHDANGLNTKPTGDGTCEKALTNGYNDTQPTAANGLLESNDDKSSDDSVLKPRESWKRQFDFLLACIGASVGLGNVWRFPYLCYKNGGGAFLIPYFLCVILGGVPMFFLEVSIGQFMGEGCIGAWKLCPLFQGIGLASTIVVFFRNVYYNIILAWAFYYLFASFTSVLPWSTCDNDWNTDDCRVSFRDVRNTTAPAVNDSLWGDISGNYSTSLTSAGTVLLGNVSSAVTNQTFVPTDPATEYWQHKVLAISDGVDNIGGVKWDLALCLLLSWIVVYFCIWKGIKSSGKVMYVTATSPYLLLLVLLFRGVTLPGAWEGIKFYILPNWEKLRDPQVWTDAGTQIFFSYSISLAQLTALGSYNQFHHNCWRDSLLYSAVNSGTSFLAGFVIFPVLGFMAYEQGLSIADVAESGPGLAFIAYPKAISQLPIAPLWSILFFITLILLGLDSQFVGVEGFITAIVDEFHTYLRRGYRKEIFIGFTCIVMYFVGLPMVTNGGAYIFQLFDYYLGSRILLIIALCECVVVAYFYGVRRYYDNIKMMLGFDIGPVMKICWAIITPVFTTALLILCIVGTRDLTYNRIYVYPEWSVGVGWMIGGSGVIMIPAIIVYRLIMAQGTLLQRFKKSIRPRLRAHQMRPEDSPKDLITYDEDKAPGDTLLCSMRKDPEANIPHV